MWFLNFIDIAALPTDTTYYWCQWYAAGMTVLLARAWHPPGWAAAPFHHQLFLQRHSQGELQQGNMHAEWWWNFCVFDHDEKGNEEDNFYDANTDARFWVGCLNFIKWFTFLLACVCGRCSWREGTTPVPMQATCAQRWWTCLAKTALPLLSPVPPPPLLTAVAVAVAAATVAVVVGRGGWARTCWRRSPSSVWPLRVKRPR